MGPIRNPNWSTSGMRVTLSYLLYCKRFDTQRNILYRSLLVVNVDIDLLTLCCLEVKFIILTQIDMHSLLYRHILRKHVAFLSADYRECNQVTISLWLTWCELVNVAIHTCEHFMLKFLLNK